MTPSDELTSGHVGVFAPPPSSPESCCPCPWPSPPGAPLPDPDEFTYDADGVAGDDIPAIAVALDTQAACADGSSRTLAIDFPAGVLPDFADALPNDATRYTDSAEAPDAGDIVSRTGLAVPDESGRLD